jgi:excisionase family DNA binding protein
MTERTKRSMGEPEQFPPSISTLEAAKRLGVTVPTIQRWLDQGELRGWKTPGGHRRIALSSVQAYIDSRMDHRAAASDGPDILIIGHARPGTAARKHGRSAAHANSRGPRPRGHGRGCKRCAPTSACHTWTAEMIRHLLLRYAALAGACCWRPAATVMNPEVSALRLAVKFLPVGRHQRCAAGRGILKG